MSPGRKSTCCRWVVGRRATDAVGPRLHGAPSAAREASSAFGRFRPSASDPGDPTDLECLLASVPTRTIRNAQGRARVITARRDCSCTAISTNRAARFVAIVRVECSSGPCVGGSDMILAAYGQRSHRRPRRGGAHPQVHRRRIPRVQQVLARLRHHLRPRAGDATSSRCPPTAGNMETTPCREGRNPVLLGISQLQGPGRQLLDACQHLPAACAGQCARENEKRGRLGGCVGPEAPARFGSCQTFERVKTDFQRRCRRRPDRASSSPDGPGDARCLPTGGDEVSALKERKGRL